MKFATSTCANCSAYVLIFIYTFSSGFPTKLPALCIIIIILVIVLVSLVSLFKTIDPKTFSRELIDYKEGPLLSDLRDQKEVKLSIW